MSRFSKGATAEPVPKRSDVPLGKNALLFGVLLFTAIVFLPTLRYEFVYDDVAQIVSNPLIRAWHFVPQYFQGQVWQHLNPYSSGNYYRPLNVLWWRINYALFGLHSIGWHASTVALHLLATALVFAIAYRISGRALLATLTALLFGVHPTRHEVVAWVSGSTESVLAVFFLAAFLTYLRSRENRKVPWMACSCVLYAAALLSKETAVVLPALVFIHACLYGLHEGSSSAPKRWGKVWEAAARTSVYLPIAFLYLILRMHVLHGFSHRETLVTFPALLLTLPSVLFFYLRQWLLPFSISQIYDVDILTKLDFRHVLVPLVTLVVAGVLLWCLRRKLGSRELLFALSTVALPLAPVLYLSALPLGEIVHDRYAYLPGFGAAFLTALGLEHLCRGKLVFRLPSRLVVAMLVILVPLSYATARASAYWQDELSLFKRSYEVAPRSITARINYAAALSHVGDKGTAMTLLTEVVKEKPDSYTGNFNLGCALYDVKLLAAAEHYLRIAQQLDPSQPGPDFQLGLVNLRMGRTNEAVGLMRRAVSLRPENSTLHFALGSALVGTGDCRSARKEFGQALLLEPTLVAAQKQIDQCTADTPVDSQSSSLTTPHLKLPVLQVKDR